MHQCSCQFIYVIDKINNVDLQLYVFIRGTLCCLVLPERGVVWEETIILLPDNVHYVFLSATIPNARQFAEWICHLHKQVGHLLSPTPPPSSQNT